MSSLDSPWPAAAAERHPETKSSTSASQEATALHNPFQLGQFALKHRIVLAPLSRRRAHNWLPQPSHFSLCYAQRTTPGGLLIAEATAVSQDAGGYPEMPGIWSEEQVEAWKPIVQAVHDKGGIFFLQLWHPGRVSLVGFTRDGEPPVSSTNRGVVNGALPQPDGQYLPCSKPRALETRNSSACRAVPACCQECHPSRIRWRGGSRGPRLPHRSVSERRHQRSQRRVRRICCQQGSVCTGGGGGGVS